MSIRIFIAFAFVVGLASLACAGPPGTNGANGKDGANGSNGATGSNGSNGSDGAPCTVVDNGDGTATVTCGASSVTIPSSSGTGAVAGSAARADSFDRSGIVVSVDGASPSISATTAADGSFAIANVPNGLHALTFTDAGHRDEHVVDVDVEGGTFVAGNVVLGIGQPLVELPEGTFARVGFVGAHDVFVGLLLDEARDVVACKATHSLVDTGNRRALGSSADGTRAFVGGNLGFAIFACATGALTAVATGPVVRVKRLAGDQVLVLSNFRFDGSGNELVDVNLVDGTTGALTVLSTSASFDAEIESVPVDGNVIFFHENAAVANGLPVDDFVVVDVASGVRAVAVPASFTSIVAIAGDQSALLLNVTQSNGDTTFERWDVAAGEVRPLASELALNAFFLNLNGKVVASVGPDVDLFDPAGNATTLVANDNFTASTVAGSGVYAMFLTGSNTLFGVDAGGTLTQLSTSPLGGMFLTSDARFVYFDEIDQNTGAAHIETFDGSQPNPVPGEVSLSSIAAAVESPSHTRAALLLDDQEFLLLDEALGGFTPAGSPVVADNATTLAFLGDDDVVGTSGAAPIVGVAAVDGSATFALAETTSTFALAPNTPIVAALEGGSLVILRAGDAPPATVADVGVVTVPVAGTDGVVYVQTNALDHRVHVLIAGE